MKHVLIAVIVEIPKPRREALVGSRYTGLFRHVGESTVAVVLVQAIRITQVGNIEVGIVIVVEVAPGYAPRVAIVLNSGSGRPRR